MHGPLSREQIRALSQRSTWCGFAMVVHCWGVILSAMALAAWQPLTIPLAIAVIGSRQLGLGILMHEGAHGGLARSPQLNLWLSQWLCAYPVFAETLGYRSYHLAHHKYAQMERDPDLVLSRPFPTSRASMRRKFIRDLTGQSGLAQRRAQFLALGLAGIGRPVLCNAAFCAALAMTGHWWLYPVLWLLPLLTWFQLVSRVRNIAEHAMVADADPWRVARTTRAGLLARAFLAPYWVNYHAEHHALLYVPCYRLKAMQRALRTNGLFGRIDMAPNYRSVMRMATSSSEDFTPSQV